MRFPFKADNWFWIVAGDISCAWSSADECYVTQWDQDRVTRIASEVELNDVLRPYGLTLPAPQESDFSAAIQAHIDATAKARGYADGVALAGYSTSTILSWVSEAQAFIAWRDAVWIYAYTELAKVQGGKRAVPTIAELIAELPPITWPGAA